jgi:hypothetical protein
MICRTAFSLLSPTRVHLAVFLPYLCLILWGPPPSGPCAGENLRGRGLYDIMRYGNWTHVMNAVYAVGMIHALCFAGLISTPGIGT